MSSGGLVMFCIIPCISVILLQAVLLKLKGVQAIDKDRKNLFLYRKFQHAITALFIVILNEILDRQIAFLACFAGFLFLLTIEVVRRNNQWFNEQYLKISSSILREEEKHKYSSAYYFLLGTSIIIFCFSKNIVSIAVLFIGIGDPFASIFGITFKSFRIYKEKSISGFLGCFITCYLSFAIYVYIYHNTSFEINTILFSSCIIGFIAGLTDFLCVFVDSWDDNLIFQIIICCILHVLKEPLSATCLIKL